ncbi:hypothetical protein H5410_048140 [Solanum commersonii]|uniref:Uncharacterized protein n=1 Tax=Solanum commersonii TaxID=4109 RepID=A0A9J5XJ25_SOLCO|nr:hypothetical protein H5410_048140 [Solanum commersonii]
MNPPKSVLVQLHKLFAKFFWGNYTGASNKHWVSWENMCYPKKEGGLGFRALDDMSNAFFAKLWWNFRTCTSLWSTEEVEHNIWWQVRGGNSSLRFDNLDKSRVHQYFIEGDNVKEEAGGKIANKAFTRDKEYIIESIKPQVGEGNDKPWWMGILGELSLSSMEEEDTIDNLRRMRIPIVSRSLMWGDIRYARAKGIGIATNTEAEVLAIHEALEYSYRNDLRNNNRNRFFKSEKMILNRLEGTMGNSREDRRY